MRAVEREQARLQGRERDAVVPAHEPLAHHLRWTVVVHGVDQERAIAQLECELHRVRDAALGVFLDDDAVDYDVQVVGFGAVEGDVVPEVDLLPVHSRADVAVAAQPFQIAAELTFLLPHDGREKGQPRAFAAIHDGVDDLLHRVGAQHLAGLGAVRRSHAGEQQA